jgi:hypothetical protein
MRDVDAGVNHIADFSIGGMKAIAESEKMRWCASSRPTPSTTRGEDAGGAPRSVSHADRVEHGGRQRRRHALPSFSASHARTSNATAFATNSSPTRNRRGCRPGRAGAFVDAVAAQIAGRRPRQRLIFPQLVARIRAAVGLRPRSSCSITAASFRFADRAVGMWPRALAQRAAAADAISFTGGEQAEPWRAAGVLGDQRVIEIVEASTAMRGRSAAIARNAIGASGRSGDLWVGRLTIQQGSADVLDGLERRCRGFPGARCHGVRRRHLAGSCRTARSRLAVLSDTCHTDRPGRA